MSEPGELPIIEQPVVPRLAATVLLLRDDPLKVLMVKRNAQGYFPSALVFPGGLVEEDDWADHWLDRCHGHDCLEDWERAVRIAGLRECWEEAAVLAAQGQFSLEGNPDNAMPLSHLMDRIGARFDLSTMAHFAHWVTPPTVPRRWDTHFLVARAPDGQTARCDDDETVGAEWISPLEAIAGGEQGKHEMLFSTRVNLLLLAESRTADEAIAVARKRAHFPVHPQAEHRADGTRVFIPKEAGYPVSECFIPSHAPIKVQGHAGPAEPS
jgi:8-oxo-dGTP pyrophosphatase MutT (NUDIX family)